MLSCVNLLVGYSIYSLVSGAYHRVLKPAQVYLLQSPQVPHSSCALIHDTVNNVYRYASHNDVSVIDDHIYDGGPVRL